MYHCTSAFPEAIEETGSSPQTLNLLQMDVNVKLSFEFLQTSYSARTCREEKNIWNWTVLCSFLFCSKSHFVAKYKKETKIVPGLFHCSFEQAETPTSCRQDNQAPWLLYTHTHRWHACSCGAQPDTNKVGLCEHRPRKPVVFLQPIFTVKRSTQGDYKCRNVFQVIFSVKRMWTAWASRQ